jgi:hypothetical protein
MSKENLVGAFGSYAPWLLQAVFIQVSNKGFYRLKEQHVERVQSLIDEVKRKWHIELRIDPDKSVLVPENTYVITLQNPVFENITDDDRLKLIHSIIPLLQHGYFSVSGFDTDEALRTISLLKDLLNLDCSINFERSIQDPEKTFVIVRK